MPFATTPPEDPDALLAALEKAVSLLAAHDVDSALVRADQLGPFAFDKRRPVLSELVGLLQRVGANYRALPLALQQRAADILDDFNTLASDLQAFDPKQVPDPRAAHDDLLGRIDRLYSGSVLDLTQIALWADQERIAREMRPERSQQLVEEIEALKEQATRAVEAAQQSAGLTSVAAHAKIFQDEASKHDSAAKGWLAAAAALAVGAIAWATFGVAAIDLAKDATTAEIVTATTSRVGVLALVVAALFFAGRNYSINRHVALTYRQKRVAIDTLQGFTEWLEDGDLRRSVIIELTRVIFAPGSTGYLSEGEASGSKLVDLAAGAINR